MISIQTHIPLKLTPFIKSFWCLKVPENISEPYIEEILPDGHQEIIFNLNSTPVRKKANSKDWLKDPTAFFTGQHSKSYMQKLHPGAIMYAIRFYPHTQRLFYDFPADLTTDSLISLTDISPVDSVLDCFCDSPQQTFANLEKEFLKRAGKLVSPENKFSYVNAAVNTIMAHNGNIRNNQLEKITGVSARYLEKSFKEYVGLSPKQFTNIIKYSSFIAYRKNHPEKTLTECAHESDFYDQSHLIHLSNLLTGQSPKVYFGKMNKINDFFLEP